MAFLRSGDPSLADDLRRRLGLGGTLPATHRVPAALLATKNVPLRPGSATVIIPIFNAAEQVERLLDRLPKTLPPHQHVLLVNDGSTDARIDAITARFTNTWAQSKVITLPRNRGFVTAVNTALNAVPPDHHAILLNSDTLPPRAWVPRLLAPFAEAPDIASVTPLSNAAEILSVPGAGVDGAPKEALIDHMDATAAQLCPTRIDLPTGIGFCMAMNYRYLIRIGGFDPVFGRGYGEEVDWCQRAKALGGRNVVATNLVVGHDGSASFGTGERRRRVSRAARIISRRYPSYDRDVRLWQQKDPLAPHRLAVAVAWVAASTDQAIPVFVGHMLGGGAETALEREVTQALSDGAPGVAILRVGGQAAWHLTFQGHQYSITGEIDDTDLMLRLLEPLTKRHVIYSCGVGAADPADLPDTLCKLAAGHRLTLRMHDYFPITPSWNLIGADGRYAGIPPLDTADPAHALCKTTTRKGATHREWRMTWGRVFTEADEVTVFAASGRDLVEAAYPDARGKTVLRPHRLCTLPAPQPRGGAALGVLGGINRAKGGAVLERLANQFARPIVVIGELDGSFRLPPPHHVHGRYSQREIAALVGRYKIGVWLLPSIWPETFSFATHEMLATGLPVAGFNLGAQAEALCAADNGHVLDLDPENTTAIAAQLDALFVGDQAPLI
ncbi:MAG: glycosyltransferase [Pseudomonadota bacterium]